MTEFDETEQAYRNGYWAGYAAGRRSAGAEPMAEDRRKWVADHMTFARIDGQLAGVIRVEDLPTDLLRVPCAALRLTEHHVIRPETEDEKAIEISLMEIRIGGIGCKLACEKPEMDGQEATELANRLLKKVFDAGLEARRHQRLEGE